MKIKTVFPFLIIVALILSTSLACSLPIGDAKDPTATAIPPTEAPTLRPLPTKTEVPPTAKPEEPVATATVDAGGDVPATDFELGDLYEFPNGAISMQPPADWSLEEDETGGSIYIEALDASATINITITNTGYELDAESFEYFVRAREENFFYGYDNYEAGDETIEGDEGFAKMYKTLDYDGIPQQVFTIYDQRGAAIFALDFWSNDDIAESTFQMFDAVIDTTYVDGTNASDFTPYNFIYTFYGPNDLFTIEVPTPWTYEWDEDDYTVVDTFTSPDGYAQIENIAYDDGSAVSKSEAGAFALELLRSYYTNGADDIRITDDKIQSDGSERLIWESKTQNFGGISFFETRGTTFLLFTVMVDNDYEDIYGDVLDDVITSYTIP